MRVTLCDVGPRDGLQNEPETLAPGVRAELIRRLAATGLPRIEAVSFVNPERVPQMAGAEEVVVAAGELDAELSGLVLNERGWERLAATSLARVNVTLAATEQFNLRNGNATLAEATERVERILGVADRPATATISVAFGCPFEGEVDPGVVAEFAERLVAAGAGEVVLADTIGVATPRPVARLVERCSILGVPVGGHFHDTRHTGVACAWAAVEAGATVLDASVGGLGGCPFAPRATGNVATEDVLYMLERERVETGVDLDALIGVARWLEELLGRELPGRVYRAGGFPASVTARIRRVPVDRRRCSGSNWSYLIVFAIAMLDAFFPIVPSEATAIAAGVVAGTGGLRVELVILAAALGAILGDNISFAGGHFLGERLNQRFFQGEKAKKRVEWARKLLEERGGYLIVVARFIPGGRTVTTFTAGFVDGMPWHRFIRFDVLAGVIWGAYTVLLGYFGGRTFEEQPWKGLLLAFAIALAVTGVVEAVRHLRRRAHA